MYMGELFPGKLPSRAGVLRFGGSAQELFFSDKLFAMINFHRGKGGCVDCLFVPKDLVYIGEIQLYQLFMMGFVGKRYALSMHNRV